MSIVVNLYYTGTNGAAHAFAREMTDLGIAADIRAEDGNERYEYFFPMDDPEMVMEVLDVIKELAQSGMTIAIVTHEMGFAREVSDRVLFLDEGIIYEQGTPEEVFDHTRTDRARDFFRKVIHS